MYVVYLTESNAVKHVIHSSASDALTLDDAEINLAACKAGTFTFTMHPGYPYYDDMVEGVSLIDVWHDENCIFAGLVRKISTNLLLDRTVTCEGLMSMLNDTIIRPESFSGTLTSVLNQIVAYHNKDIAANGNTDYLILLKIAVQPWYTYSLDAAVTANMDTTMTVVKAALEAQDDMYYYVTRGNDLHKDENARLVLKPKKYIMETLSVNEQKIMLGQNILDLNAETTKECGARYLIPLGAKQDSSDERLTITSVKGIDYISTGITTVEENKTIVKIWDDITDAQELLEAAESYVAQMSQKKICLELTAFDLNFANADITKFKLLDKVYVGSEPHGIDDEMIITKMKINLNDPRKNKITLGDELTKTISEKVR